MKYLRTYEFYMGDYRQYCVIREIDEDLYCLVEYIPNYFSRNKKIKVIEPDYLDNFDIWSDEIAEDEYQDEFGRIWQFLYSSGDLDKTRKEYKIHTTSNKYNL